MDFIRNHLPECPLQARKFHCPATALNLDSEIAGVFWIYFCGRTIAQLFPGGIQFEVHVYIDTNEEEDGNAEEADHEEDIQVQGGGDAGIESDVMIALREQAAVEDLT